MCGYVYGACVRFVGEYNTRRSRALAAGYISTAYTIRKFMFLVTVAYRPWPPRPSTEPTGRNGHAVHRTGRGRALLARQTCRSMAAVPSSSPRLFRGDQNDMLLGTTHMAHTDLHRSTTQRMELSGAAHQAHVCHARTVPLPM